MDARAHAAGIRRHQQVIEPLPDDELIARIEGLEPLPDADDGDPAWLEDATWDRAEFMLAAADAIGERRLVRAIAPLFQLAALGDGYEMMQGLRHGPERAASPQLAGPDQHHAPADPPSAGRLPSLGSPGPGHSPRPAQAPDDLVSALGDQQPMVRCEACTSLGMLAQAASPIRQQVPVHLKATAEHDASSQVRRHAQWAVDMIT